MSFLGTPHLDEIRAAGPFHFEGEMLSSLTVEARGDRLEIVGLTPAREDEREGYTQEEYRYELRGREAERLLSLLNYYFGDRPELVIAREFEFSKPFSPLFEYLEYLKIKFEYYEEEI